MATMHQPNRSPEIEQRGMTIIHGKPQTPIIVEYSGHLVSPVHAERRQVQMGGLGRLNQSDDF
jgi:hypothetical protein